MTSNKYDYSKLFGLMREKNFTQRAVAEHLGISETAFNKKLKNKSEFKQTEMLSILDFLGQPCSDVISLFFTH